MSKKNPTNACTKRPCDMRLGFKRIPRPRNIEEYEDLTEEMKQELIRQGAAFMAVRKDGLPLTAEERELAERTICMLEVFPTCQAMWEYNDFTMAACYI